MSSKNMKMEIAGIVARVGDIEHLSFGEAQKIEIDVPPIYEHGKTYSFQISAFRDNVILLQKISKGDRVSVKCHATGTRYAKRDGSGFSFFVNLVLDDIDILDGTEEKAAPKDNAKAEVDSDKIDDMPF